MEKRTTTRHAARVFHPGEMLLDELNARQLTQAEFSAIIDRPARTVNEIIKGKRGITPETAEVIGAALDTSADMWLGMQAEYDLYQVSKKEKNRIAEVQHRSELYNLFPVVDLVRRKYISARKKASELEQEILKLLEKQSIDEIRDFALLRTSGGDISQNYINTWIILGKKAALKQTGIGKFDKDALVEFAKEIRFFSRKESGIEEIVNKLNSLGVRIVVLPHFSKTRVDGAACWISDQEPVILLSLRFDRIDNFYFTLLHEIGHIVLHPNSNSFIDVDIFNPKADQKEQEANDFALNNLGFKSIASELQYRELSPRLLIKKSEELGIHPGLLIGHLQHYLNDYTLYRKGLIPIKETVPTSILQN